MQLWLEDGLVKITKEMIQRVTGYPTIQGKRTMKCSRKEDIQANTQAVWNKCGMMISTITDPKIDFSVRVIS